MGISLVLGEAGVKGLCGQLGLGLGWPMRESEKFRSDLRRWESKPLGDGSSLEGLRAFFFRALPGMPRETLSDFFTSFLDRCRSGSGVFRPEDMDRLSGIASLLSGQYDGTLFSREEWIEIRDTVSASASEISLDDLTGIMALVLEHGAID
jgi:hypothetical protein